MNKPKYPSRFLFTNDEYTAMLDVSLIYSITCAKDTSIKGQSVVTIRLKTKPLDLMEIPGPPEPIKDLYVKIIKRMQEIEEFEQSKKGK